MHLSHNETREKFTYGSQESAVVRNSKNLKEEYIAFEGHSKNVTMVQHSPVGQRVLSGDEIGMINVWNSDHPTLLSSIEMQGLLGAVHDGAFTDDGEKCAFVGEFHGGKVGKGINVQMKKTDAEITYHAARCLSCTYKANRPYKLYTASEDNAINISAPVQYSMSKSLKQHKGFVNCVRASPDNKLIISASTDKSLVIWSTETDEHVKVIENAHGGSIYSLAWFEDGSKFASVSADKTVKIWTKEGENVSTLHVAEKPTLDDMQMGVVKLKHCLISLSLSGNLNIWNNDTLAQANVTKPDQIVYGHNVT